MRSQKTWSFNNVVYIMQLAFWTNSFPFNSEYTKKIWTRHSSCFRVSHACLLQPKTMRWIRLYQAAKSSFSNCLVISQQTVKEEKKSRHISIRWTKWMGLVTQIGLMPVKMSFVSKNSTFWISLGLIWIHTLSSLT